MKIINIPRRFVKEEWGGTETVILETCRRLQQRGQDVSIFTSMALAQKRFELIAGIAVKRFAHFYPYFGLNSEIIASLDKKSGNLFSWPLFFSLLREKNVDLIHLHTGKRMAGIAARAAMIKRIPFVISLHGGLLDVPQAEAISWTEPTRGCFEWGRILGALFASRQVLQKAAAVICVNRDEAQKITKAGLNSRVIYLPNGVDARKFKTKLPGNFRAQFAIPEHAFMILTCGRIDPQKNQLFLLEQMPELLQIWPDLYLVFLGPSTNTSYCEQIKSHIARSGLEKRVILAGGLPPGHPDIVSAYQQANLFVLPSIHEPFGIVILEAWAAGLPVIAAKTGGIPGFVKDGDDALLFEPGNSAAFLESCRKLRSNPRLMSLLAKNGETKAGAEYDWEVITSRLEKIYGELR